MFDAGQFTSNNYILSLVRNKKNTWEWIITQKKQQPKFLYYTAYVYFCISSAIERWCIYILKYR